MPPLRERKEDIPALAAYFLDEFARAYGRKPKELTPQALEALDAHQWPGNVRELRNLIERIVILQSAEQDRCAPYSVADWRGRARRRPAERYGSLQDVREAAEREYIQKKLEEANGNVSRAAELLGLERSNLYRKMRALGIAGRE